MIISRTNIWAVANIICWGTQVEASSHRRRRDEAPPPKRQATSEYFQTQWTLPPNNLWPIDVNQTITYKVTSDVSVQGGEKLPLMLLWTSAQVGTPTTENTHFVFEVPPCE